MGLIRGGGLGKREINKRYVSALIEFVEVWAVETVSVQLQVIWTGGRGYRMVFLF
jgi:hypothetical protein